MGELNVIAIEVNEEANEMADTIIEKYLREHIVEDRSSTMEMWRLREQARMVAEEVVLVDVINRYRWQEYSKIYCEKVVLVHFLHWMVDNESDFTVWTKVAEKWRKTVLRNLL